MDKEHVVCVTMRVSMSQEHLPDCTKDICVICKEEVWVSPSSRTIIAERNAEINCLECAIKGINNETVIEPLTKEQKQEIASHTLDKN